MVQILHPRLETSYAPSTLELPTYPVNESLRQQIRLQVISSSALTPQRQDGAPFFFPFPTSSSVFPVCSSAGKIVNGHSVQRGVYPEYFSIFIHIRLLV